MFSEMFSHSFQSENLISEKKGKIYFSKYFYNSRNKTFINWFFNKIFLCIHIILSINYTSITQIHWSLLEMLIL